MEYTSIKEIYDANAQVRERLKEAVADLSEEAANTRPGGEKWSVAEIVEHIAKVNGGALRICGRLLQNAGEADGAVEVKVSASFRRKAGEIAAMKLEAPEIVQPGGTRTIRESLDDLTALETKYSEMRSLFEKLDGSSETFRHPFFGDITAHEWLALSGGHEARHLRQIEKILLLVRK